MIEVLLRVLDAQAHLVFLPTDVCIIEVSLLKVAAKNPSFYFIWYGKISCFCARIWFLLVIVAES